MTSPMSAPRFVPCYDRIHSPREPRRDRQSLLLITRRQAAGCINLFGFVDHKQLQAQTNGGSCCRRSDEHSSPGCRLAKPIGDSSRASLGLAISVASVITAEGQMGAARAPVHARESHSELRCGAQLSIGDCLMKPSGAAWTI